MKWRLELDAESRRRTQRFPLEVRCRLHMPDGTVIACDSGDLSLHGLQLQLEDPPKRGTTIELDTHLPSGVVRLVSTVVHANSRQSTVGLELDKSCEGYEAWCAWLKSWA